MRSALRKSRARHRPATRALQLQHLQHALPAGHFERIVRQSQEVPTRVRPGTWQRTAACPCRRDATAQQFHRLTAQARLGHGPGIEGAYLPVDVRGT